MKHLFRFHGRRLEAGQWELFEDEWHHILKVLRLHTGEKIEISDGQGWVAQASLGELGRHKGELLVGSDVFYPKVEPAFELTLGLGILKPQGIDEVLPGLVELGVHRLVLIPFFGMDRSRVSDKLIDRWQRQIVAASKQAKAAWFAELVIAKSLSAFLETSGSFPTRYLLDPEGQSVALDGLAVGPVLGVIGSEGGWNEAEAKEFEAAGFFKMRLKSNILRATTAVLASAAILRQGMGESR